MHQDRPKMHPRLPNLLPCYEVDVSRIHFGCIRGNVILLGINRGCIKIGKRCIQDYQIFFLCYEINISRIYSGCIKKDNITPIENDNITPIDFFANASRRDIYESAKNTAKEISRLRKDDARKKGGRGLSRKSAKLNLFSAMEKGGKRRSSPASHCRSDSETKAGRESMWYGFLCLN